LIDGWPSARHFRPPNSRDRIRATEFALLLGGTRSSVAQRRPTMNSE
jgi:hypothetical protein